MQPRVVVVGAGLAAFETLFLLRSRLHGRADLQLVCEREDFLFRPNLVYVPFGADVARSQLSLDEALVRDDIEVEHGRVVAVDSEAGQVHLHDGRRLPYEHLVIAADATPREQGVAGLAEHAVSICDVEGALTLRERFAHVRGQARERARPRVLFVVPRHSEHSLPLYEVALMLDTWLRREKVRGQVEIAFVTHEASFAEAWGPRMHEIVEREFAERQIEAYLGQRVVEVSAHETSFEGGRAERFDVLAVAPPLASNVRYSGLPADDRGFLRVQADTRQVLGHPELYAPGDAGDFPLKDTFLSLLQAESAADHLTSVIRTTDFKRPFDAMSMYIADMLDRAAFVQLPLTATGDPNHPVGLRPGADADYKVSVSPLWRMGRRMFASYLMMRFAAGEPFQAGAGWRLMDVGVHAMAGMLAE